MSSFRCRADIHSVLTLCAATTPDTCGQCRLSFSTTVRRHHCRLCGGLFCYNCAPERQLAGANDSALRCCGSCNVVLELGQSAGGSWSADRLGQALRQRWRTRLTQLQLAPTQMDGLARRPAHFGGVGPWLITLLRGCAWEDSSCETLLDALAESVDYAMTEDGILAAEAVAGRRATAPPTSAMTTAGAGATAVGEAAAEAVAMVSGLTRGLTGMFSRG